MRRVLIDECLPVQLHRWLDGVEARSATFMGWKGLQNGELLARAAGRFDVLLTSDFLLASQHDLARLGMAVVVVPANRRSVVEAMVPAIREALLAVRPGHVIRLAEGEDG